MKMDRGCSAPHPLLARLFSASRRVGCNKWGDTPINTVRADTNSMLCLHLSVIHAYFILLDFFLATHPELGFFRVIFAFCDTVVAQNAEITRKNPSSALKLFLCSHLCSRLAEKRDEIHVDHEILCDNTVSPSDCISNEVVRKKRDKNLDISLAVCFPVFTCSIFASAEIIS